jgi:hypothetical protein
VQQNISPLVVLSHNVPVLPDGLVSIAGSLELFVNDDIFVRLDPSMDGKEPVNLLASKEAILSFVTFVILIYLFPFSFEC